MRSIINVDFDVTNENLPTLDIPQEEIDLIALSDNSFWPAIAPWGVTPEDDGFKDKAKSVLHLCPSATTVSSKFGTAPDGGAAYLVGSSGTEIVANSVDFSQGLTVGILCSADVAFGSVNPTPPGVWFVLSSAQKLRWQLPSDNSGFGDFTGYDGPLLSTSEMNTVIFVVDRILQKAYLRVNGQICMEGSIPSDADLRNELMIGSVNAGTQVMRSGYIRSSVAFNRALGESGISALEAYLISLKS